ncbi:pseudouridine synthase family protein [Thalassotalea maritima]|uniref:pseudouridine synthase family protein n=1 Tax=Thalassotalea maritima TaxID=3242416 RepID=UPI003528AE90
MTPLLSPSRQHIQVTVDDEQVNAVQYLASASRLSIATIKQAMQKGCVWHKRGRTLMRLRRAKKALKIGDSIELYYDEKILSQQVEDAVLIADEGDFSVWYKPFAMQCNGSKWGDHTTINRFVETHLTPQRPVFLVHRLDRATTGLIVLAHTKAMARTLTQLFAQRGIDKRYQALVSGDMREKLPCKSELPIDDKSALTLFELAHFNHEQQRTLLNVQLGTGRKHQIRKHLAAMGFPIIGDRLYGDVSSYQADENLQLCSVLLAFDLDKKSYRFQLPQAFCLSV